MIKVKEEIKVEPNVQIKVPRQLNKLSFKTHWKQIQNKYFSNTFLIMSVDFFFFDATHFIDQRF